MIFTKSAATIEEAKKFEKAIETLGFRSSVEVAGTVDGIDGEPWFLQCKRDAKLGRSKKFFFCDGEKVRATSETRFCVTAWTTD